MLLHFCDFEYVYQVLKTSLVSFSLLVPSTEMCTASTHKCDQECAMRSGNAEEQK